MAELARRKREPQQLGAVVGQPAQRQRRVHVGLHRLVEADRLEQAHRPVVDRHGAGAGVDLAVALERDRRDAERAQRIRRGDPARAVADDRDVGVVTLVCS